MTSFLIRVINLTLFVVELAVPTGLFIRKLNFRRFWGLWLFLGLLAVVAASFLITWLKEVILSSIDTSVFSFLYFVLTYLLTMLSQVIFFVLYDCMVYCVFKTSIFNTLFIGCMSFFAQSIASSLFSLYLRIRGFEAVFLMRAFNDPVNIAVFFCIYAAVYVLYYFIFVRKYESGDENYLNQYVLLALVGLILINVFLGSINAPQDSEQAAVLYLFLLLARVLLSILGLVILIAVLDLVKLHFQRSQLQHILQQQREQYEIAKENIDTVNINAHDLRHQISVILSAVQKTDYSPALATELEEMAKSVNMVDTSYHTGNKALDITLTEKSRVCQSKSINLSVIADGSGLKFMTDVDIYTLVGNALDNAIEATERLPDIEDRIISFSLRKRDDILSIHVENTFLDLPKFVGGIPQTSKSDKSVHGYGVKSIVHIVNKYEGNVKMRAINGLFYLDILFPDKTTD